MVYIFFSLVYIFSVINSIVVAESANSKGFGVRHRLACIGRQFNRKVI